MKIHSVKVRGAIGFKKGLGVDEIDLDFTGLSGLIALSGPNGMGKTTLLENLSPYRMMPSREGALQHNFFLKDSFRDLTFEFGGDLYRTLVKMNAESGRGEGQVWKNGEPQIKDSKRKDYDRYVAGLMGSSNLFYSSVFCAQDADKMSDMTTGQLKALFVEFLRLDRLAGYEAVAKQCGAILRGNTVQVERSIEDLEKKIKDLSEVESSLKIKEEEAVELTQAIDDTKRSVNTEIEIIENLKETQAQNVVNLDRKRDLGKDIQAVMDERTVAYKRHSEQRQQDLKTIETKRTTLITFQPIIVQKKAILEADTKARDLEEEIEDARECYDNAGQSLEELYRKADDQAQTLQVLEADLEGLKNNPELEALWLDAEVYVQTIKNIEDEIKRLTEELNDSGPENDFELVGLNSKIEACEKAMAILDQRGECPVEKPKCRFVVSAIDARNRVKSLEKQLQQRYKDIAKNQNDLSLRIDELRGAFSDNIYHLQGVALKINAFMDAANEKQDQTKSLIIEAKAALQDIRASITAVQMDREVIGKTIASYKVDLGKVRELAQEKSKIEAAERETVGLEKDIQALKDKIGRDISDYNESDLASNSKLRKLEQRLAKVEALIEKDIEEKLKQAKKRRTAHEEADQSLKRQLGDIERQITVRKQRLQEREGLKKDLEKAQTELGRIAAESAQWLYLQNACGKTGLQALEIDGVAPSITGYANDLLTSSFGPNFSTKLITQDPETGKEILDVIVLRGDGSETSFKKLSGGEKVWVLKSQRLGMTLISKEKSGRDFRTILCDEEDGSLDEEKSQSFVGLYKAVLDVGGFEDCFFISHNRDVISMADHQIRFSGEGIEVI